MNPHKPHSHTADSLRQAVLSQAPFAAYRQPSATEVKLLLPEAVKLSRRLNEVKTMAFILYPFGLGESSAPLVLSAMQPPQVLPIEAEDADNTFITARTALQLPPPDEVYARTFGRFMQALQSRQYAKLVLSHIFCHSLEGCPPAETLFLRACRCYPQAFVYLCRTDEGALWLGATPEVLLGTEGHKMHTMALAGTRRAGQGAAGAAWDEKNVEEHEMVADYIRQALFDLGFAHTEQPRHTRRAGVVEHLCTGFSFPRPADQACLHRLLHRLNPTPAVCGLPKEAAYHFICREEPHDRKYYTGVVGLLGPEAQSQLYVNLRCMELSALSCHLYVGGGLTARSVLADEWREVCYKSLAMRRLWH